MGEIVIVTPNDDYGSQFRWVMRLRGERIGFFTYWIDAAIVAMERGYIVSWRD